MSMLSMPRGAPGSLYLPPTIQKLEHFEYGWKVGDEVWLATPLRTIELANAVAEDLVAAIQERTPESKWIVRPHTKAGLGRYFPSVIDPTARDVFDETTGRLR